MKLFIIDHLTTTIAAQCSNATICFAAARVTTAVAHGLETHVTMSATSGSFGTNQSRGSVELLERYQK